jgi:frataxin-like iron-binding protein CyaY
MTKARNLADNALTTVSPTELGYVDGVTSSIQTQLDARITNALVDAKGDILTATADNVPARLAVGTDGQVLTAASGQTTGLQWAAGLPSQTGNTGKFLTTDGSAASWGSVSQPITWTQRVAANSNSDIFQKIEYNGSNLWVAVGATGMLYSSSNGTTWTSRTSQFATTGIQDVAYGNGLWVAVGSSGKISTSPDGTTLTARTANMSTNTIYAVTYANSLWVAVGNGGGTTNTGGLTYSTDGITWTRKSQSLTIGAAYRTVAWNGTNWIIGAEANTNNYLYASTPSGTWTVGATGSGSDTYKIIWDGTRHTVLSGGSYGTPYYSTSTTLGAVTAMVGGPQIPVSYAQYTGTFLYYSGKYYMSNGSYIQSFAAVSGNPVLDAPIPLPSALSQLTPYLQGGIQGFWVGAAGYIVSGNAGQIYTSF